MWVNVNARASFWLLLPMVTLLVLLPQWASVVWCRQYYPEARPALLPPPSPQALHASAADPLPPPAVPRPRARGGGAAPRDARARHVPRSRGVGDPAVAPPPPARQKCARAAAAADVTDKRHRRGHAKATTPVDGAAARRAGASIADWPRLARPINCATSQLARRGRCGSHRRCPIHRPHRRSHRRGAARTTPIYLSTSMHHAASAFEHSPLGASPRLRPANAPPLPRLRRS